MFIDLGIQLKMNDEQFVAEMAHRREVLGLDVNDWVVGCPLCMAQIPLLPEVEEAEAGAPSNIEASSAAALLGTWALPLETGQGTFDLSLVFSEGADGMVAASVITPNSGAQAVESIRRYGEDVILGFTLNAFGQSIDTTITLTPAGEGGGAMSAAVDLDGLMALSGTATKEG
jgi:hypothetical protein